MFLKRNDMIKIILATALILATFTFAQFGQTSKTGSVDKNDYYYHPHTGLYFTTNLTFGYASLNSHHEESGWDDDETWNTSFTGWWTPYIETRLGGYYSDVAAFYGAIGFGCGIGEYEKIDASSTKMLFGLGGEFYPFQNKESALYGIFFGIFFGAAIEGVEVGKATVLLDEKRSDKKENFHNIFGRIEAGYDWWFSTRWRAGVAFNYSYGRFVNNENGRFYESYKDREVISNHNFGLTIRIAH